MSDLVLQGVELGTADDLVMGRTNSKLGEGTVGALERAPRVAEVARAGEALRTTSVGLVLASLARVALIDGG